jgi:hypothetical protein
VVCRYYDAGDFVKFNLPQAFAMTMLAWGVLEFKEVLLCLAHIQHV